MVGVVAFYLLILGMNSFGIQMVSTHMGDVGSYVHMRGYEPEHSTSNKLLQLQNATKKLGFCYK